VYTVYNQGKGRNYEPINWEDIKEQVEKFRSEQIYAHIAAIEKETRVCAFTPPPGILPLTHHWYIYGIWHISFAKWTAKQNRYLMDYRQLLDDWENNRPDSGDQKISPSAGVVPANAEE